MRDVDQVWQAVATWLRRAIQETPASIPPEIPGRDFTGFSVYLAKLERSVTASLEPKIGRLSWGGELPDLTDLERWFFHRRLEWALYVITLVGKKEIDKAWAISRVIQYLLIDSWETDGQRAFWTRVKDSDLPSDVGSGMPEANGG